MYPALPSVYLRFFDFFSKAVAQDYNTETHNVYVILGNSALLKCEIPSFVIDFVSVDSWVDNEGNEVFKNAQNYGN